MKKTKSKKSSWIDVKASIEDYQDFQYIGLIKDLYKLSDKNKNFLHTRCLAGSVHLQPYKDIIYHALYHDVMDENNNFDFERAEEAVDDYRKAADDEIGTVDLMIHFVECGHKFTLDYGDINEIFYDVLVVKGSSLPLTLAANDCVTKVSDLDNLQTI